MFNYELLKPYFSIIFALLLFSIIYCYIYDIKITTFLGTFVVILILLNIFCSLFKISPAKIILNVIIPIFKLILSFYYIIVSLAYLPYYIVLTIWQSFLKILGMFAFVISFINNIGMFFINLTNDVYLVT